MDGWIVKLLFTQSCDDAFSPLVFDSDLLFVL